MSLDAWLATITKHKHYKSEEQQEYYQIYKTAKVEKSKIYKLFEKYNISYKTVFLIIKYLKKNENL